MAEQAEADDVHDEDIDILDQGGDADDQGDGGQDEGADAADQGDDDVEILFGDEAAPASEEKSEPDLIRKLRAELREKSTKLAKYDRGEIQPPAAPKVIEVGPKPTLAACGYDEERFEAERDAWDERSRQAEEAKAANQRQADAYQAELNKDVERYQSAKAALGLRDFQVSQDTVRDALSQNQISGILQAADDSAKFIYALGKHPAKLEALKAITNPVKFIAAVAKLEGTLKVTKTSRKAPELDTPVRGSAPLSASKDKHEAKLEAKAAQTGNRTELIAYRAKLKKQAK